MSSHILDSDTYPELILLLYSETIPYTSIHPSGITMDLFSKECKKLGIDLEWKDRHWNKNQIATDKIFIYVGIEKRDIVLFTKRLRHAFAHCNISVTDGIIHAQCNEKYENGKAKGKKVFELLVSIDKLIALLTFIKQNKRK